MRMNIVSIPIGNMGALHIEVEDRWIYPVISLGNEQGEESLIYLQHTSVKQLHKIADAIKATAFKLSKSHGE